MQIVRVFPASEAEWDSPLLRTSEAGLLQSCYWASVLQDVDRAESVFLVMQEAQQIAMQSLLLLENVSARVFTDHPLHWLSLQAGKLWGHRLTCHDGPVLSEGTGMDCLGEWIEYIECLANDNAVAEIGPICFARTSQYRTDQNVRRLFEEHGFSTKTWGTFLTDLTPDIEEIWKSVESNARNKVRKAERCGVRLKKINSLDEYRCYYYEPYAAHARHRRRLGLRPPSLKVIEAMFRHDQAGINHFFSVVDEDDNVLAVAGLHCFNGVATIMSTGITELAYERKIPAQDWLRWKMIEWAKENGYRLWDVGGVNPDPKTEADINLYRFKEKWGGELITYHSYSKLRLSPLRRVFRQGVGLAYRLLIRSRAWGRQ